MKKIDCFLGVFFPFYYIIGSTILVFNYGWIIFFDLALTGILILGFLTSIILGLTFNSNKMNTILGIELKYIRSITSSTSRNTHTVTVHYYKNSKVGKVNFAAHNLKDKQARFKEYRDHLKSYQQTNH